LVWLRRESLLADEQSEQALETQGFVQNGFCAPESNGEEKKQGLNGLEAGLRRVR
jgi:hypothetical protein